MKSIFDYGQGFFKGSRESLSTYYKALKDPVHVTLSGGRSSGATLAVLLDIFDGKLPSNYKIIFTNTGKEHPATLDFLKAIAENWHVEVVWLELAEILPGGRHGLVVYKIVDYHSASRNGEPFEIMVKDKNHYPNRARRTCTFYMKIKTAEQYLERELGWSSYEKIIGYRADEKQRLHNMMMRCGKNATLWKPSSPLISLGIVKSDTLSFWKEQPFDLGIPHEWGNCTFCFLKSAKLPELARQDPEQLEWWVNFDKGPKLKSGKRWFMLPNGGYAGLKARMLENKEIEEPLDISDLDCNCTD
jgi:hypothetical protein